MMKSFVLVMLFALFVSACANGSKAESSTNAMASSPKESPSPSIEASTNGPTFSDSGISEKEMSKIRSRVNAQVANWISPAKEIIQKIKDDDSSLYLHALENHEVQIPVDSGDKIGLLNVFLLERPSEPWVGIIFVEDDNVSPAWKKEFSKEDFIAEYSAEWNSLIIHNYRCIGIPKVLSGLIFMHEMRHWKQANFKFNPDPRYKKQLIEVDAYDYEFWLFDQLHIPGFGELIAKEKDRLRADFLAGKSVSPGCPVSELRKIFPDLGDETNSVKVTQTEIFLMALFKIIEEGSEAQRQIGKLKLMAGIYK
jgi:hypothetical protein